MAKTKKEEKPEEIKEIEVTEETSELPGFDLSKYAAKPLETGINIKKKIVKIPAERPNNQTYFRAHPNLAQLVDIIYDADDRNKPYLINQNKVRDLIEFTKRAILYVCVKTSNDPFLLPVHQPDAEGKQNPWHESRQAAVNEAKENWVRLQPNQKNQCYDVIVAEGNLAEPKWPELNIQQYLELAFKNAIVDTEDHPLVKKLRGLV
jgi:hypothetical protein